MHSLVSKLLIYRNIGRDSILFRLADVCKRIDAGGFDREALASEVLDLIHELLDLATLYGFNHNLWRNYLAYLLAMTENPFTLVSEKVGAVDGSVNQFVLSDFDVFFRLLHYDFSALEEALELDCFTLLQNYRSVEKKEHAYNRNVSVRLQELSAAIGEALSREELCRVVVDFYQKYGVGPFGMNKAFRIASDRAAGLIVPIMTTSNVGFDELVGYEWQKAELIGNTRAFLEGRPANNALLYGDAGTGKSTSVKALLNMFYEAGLRVVEIYKHDFKLLPEIISIVKSRNYKFIIYMDDLSFEGAETEYKYLKAVIEGDLEVRPDNVLIYATSNRRHLLRETFSDRQEIDEDDVHRGDTMAERLSLASRFGVTIGYYKPERQQYFDIVRQLAERSGLTDLTEDQLVKEADLWARNHGGLSGRTARQYIDTLLGQRNDEKE